MEQPKSMGAKKPERHSEAGLFRLLKGNDQIVREQIKIRMSGTFGLSPSSGKSLTGSVAWLNGLATVKEK